MYSVDRLLNCGSFLFSFSAHHRNAYKTDRRNIQSAYPSIALTQAEKSTSFIKPNNVFVSFQGNFAKTGVKTLTFQDEIFEFASLPIHLIYSLLNVCKCRLMDI